MAKANGCLGWPCCYDSNHLKLLIEERLYHEASKRRCLCNAYCYHQTSKIKGLITLVELGI